MIKNMKISLKKTLGARCLEKVELETALVEVEASLNSRPLTFVGDDLENGHPLTPSHFLLMKGSHLSKVGDDSKSFVTDSPTVLKEHYQMIDAQLTVFWNRWQDEYLKQLPLPNRKDKVGNVEVGSVILLREDNCPRLHWPIGVIEELIQGRDGVCRTVKVKTKAGSFTRPIQRVHDLELHVSSKPVIPVLDSTCKPMGDRTSRSGRVLKTPNRY